MVNGKPVADHYPEKTLVADIKSHGINRRIRDAHLFADPTRSDWAGRSDWPDRTVEMYRTARCRRRGLLGDRRYFFSVSEIVGGLAVNRIVADA